MSGLARQLLGATGALTTVTGSVFGSGSLAIPAGVVLVTLTGQGGTGGDNSYYNPGQPYVAPSGYHAAVSIGYTAGIWNHSSGTLGENGGTSSLGLPNFTSYAGTAYGSWYADNPPTLSRLEQFFSSGSYYYITSSYYMTASGSVIAAIPAYYDTPGQPYIAPTSGGGVYSGGNTTATLNSVTDTWAGGYGGAATSSVQTLASTGAGQAMTYTIASGGSLNYSYTY